MMTTTIMSPLVHCFVLHAAIIRLLQNPHDFHPFRFKIGNVRVDSLFVVSLVVVVLVFVVVIIVVLIFVIAIVIVVGSMEKEGGSQSMGTHVACIPSERCG